jgi:alkylated DNA repair dioxygenase AlkB
VLPAADGWRGGATAGRNRIRHGVPLVLELAPRSMYAFAGAARWKWQHGILPTPGLRYSITFRTLAERARKPTRHA